MDMSKRRYDEQEAKQKKEKCTERGYGTTEKPDV